MAFIRFYKRTKAIEYKSRHLQDGDCIICAGAWTAMYYPATGEWFDIYNKAAPGSEAFEAVGLKVENISFKEYLSYTGRPGFKRAINCFLKRLIFNVADQKPLEEYEEKEYTDTDDFFLEGPGGGLGDLRPPVIFGGIVTGETEDGFKD